MQVSHLMIRATNSDRRPDDPNGQSPPEDTRAISASANLLEQMFSELRALALNNPDFARVLSSRGSDTRARLWTLHEIVALLTRDPELSHSAQLAHRANTLIGFLSRELEELTEWALGDALPNGTSAVTLH
jgi:hypothetical protein